MDVCSCLYHNINSRLWLQVIPHVVILKNVSFLQGKISATHKHSTQLQPMMSSLTDPSPISEEDSVQI